MKGLVHIYTGDGKGKTTAAVGLCVRACGVGRRVLFVQFLKGRATGEIAPLKAIGVDIVRSDGVLKFIPAMTEQERGQCRASQQKCLQAAQNALGRYDLIVLDEAIGAAATGMIGLNELVRLIQSRPDDVELVFTGRDAPQELLALADYVSDIRAVRHPYEKGIGAREGIEY